MKKIFTFVLIILCFGSHVFGKINSFDKKIFQNAQSDGKIVVINSWNKTCTTCAKQVKILNQAKNDFKNVVFLSFEQTKDKDVADYFSIDYWTTIVVYKNYKELSRSIGRTNKEKIYSQIQSLN